MFGFLNNIFVKLLIIKYASDNLLTFSFICHLLYLFSPFTMLSTKSKIYAKLKKNIFLNSLFSSLIKIMVEKNRFFPLYNNPLCSLTITISFIYNLLQICFNRKSLTFKMAVCKTSFAILPCPVHIPISCNLSYKFLKILKLINKVNIHHCLCTPRIHLS